MNLERRREVQTRDKTWVYINVKYRCYIFNSIRLDEVTGRSVDRKGIRSEARVLRFCGIKRLEDEEEALGLEGVTREKQRGFSPQLKTRFQGHRVIICLKCC